MNTDLEGGAAQNRATRAFTTHSNYIRAFALLAGSNNKVCRDVLETLNSRVRGTCSFGLEHSGLDVAQIKASLAHAWGTELLLALGAEYLTDDEVVRISNNWAVIQAYYTLYHATQALAVAKGFPRPESHPKTQNQYASLWLQSSVTLEPWTLSVGPAGCQNVPTDVTIDLAIHSWKACDQSSCWSIAAKALKTTREIQLHMSCRRKREELLRTRKAEWKAEEDQRLARGRRPRAERKLPMPRLDSRLRARVDNKLRAYGLMDYLYRLRIRSNYEDSVMFTQGPTDPFASERVRDNLVYLVSATLLVHELHVRALVGDTAFDGWADEWIKLKLSDGKRLGFALRREFLS